MSDEILAFKMLACLIEGRLLILQMGMGACSVFCSFWDQFDQYSDFNFDSSYLTECNICIAMSLMFEFTINDNNG